MHGKDIVTQSPLKQAVFIGDSITDSGRRNDPSGHLGAGYVRRIDGIAHETGSPLRIINRGVGGDRVIDLQQRWQSDCLDERPDILTVLIGANDTWRRYDSNMPTSADQFHDIYSEILSQARTSLELDELVIMEPFLVPITDQQQKWRDEDLIDKIAAVRSLAVEHDATLIPLDELFTQQAQEKGPASVIDDGVHPSAGGHQLIADTWWHTVGVRYGSIMETTGEPSA